MYFTFKNKLKKYLIALLAIMMAVMLALCCACSSDEDSDSDDDDDTTTTVEATDYQEFTNGDFEFGTFEKESTDFPYSSVTGWTKSLDSDVSSAPSSSATSGIVDTKADVYNNMSSSNKTYYTIKNGDADELYNPGTPYSVGRYSTDFINENKWTDDEDDNDYDTKKTYPRYEGTKVLAINNKTTNGRGTAQYYTSSDSFTVDVNKEVVLSVYVLTKNLSNPYNSETGAYISLNVSVNGVSFEKVVLDNIDTKGVWALYNIAIKGSTYASASISSIKLGLGHGNGSDQTRYVEGMAFFDNVVLTLDGEMNATADKTITLTDNVEDKHTESEKAVTFTDTEYTRNINVVLPVKPETINNYVAAVTYTFNTIYLSANDARTFTDGDNGAEQVSTFKPEYLDQDMFNPNDSSKKYVFEFNTPSSATIKTSGMPIAGDSYVLFTFYAKVKITNTSTNGLSVSVIENSENNDKTLTSCFTITETVDEEGSFGLWNRYTILIHNEVNELTQIKLCFTFGLVDGKTSTYNNYKNELPEGYALLGGFACDELTEDQVSLLATGDNAKEIHTLGQYTIYEEDDKDETTDSYNMTVGGSEKASLQTQLVETTSYYYSGEGNVNHGVINSKYISTLSTNNKVSFNSIDSKLSGDNKYVQALVLDNLEDTAKSRYIKSEATFSANTYNVVKVSLYYNGTGSTTVKILNSKYDNGFNVLKVGEKELITTINSDTIANTASGWIDVYFYIATGDYSKGYKIQVENTGLGYVLINDISVSTVADEATYNDTKDDTIEAYQEWSTIASKPALVFNTTDATFVNNPYVTFASYETIDVEEEEEEEETEEEEEEEDEDEKPYTVESSAFLQVTSIIIAAVLIFVIVVVVVRQLNKKNSKKKAKIQSYYDRSSRDEAMKKISKKNESKEVSVEEADESEEYNYDEAEAVEETPVEENNIEDEVIEVPVDEEVVEIPTDEEENK